MNVAIIGLGTIAKRVAQGVNFASQATLYAVGARDIKRAQQFKEHYGAQVAYGCYEQLLEDPQVELVYVCVPNHLHHDLIKQCLSAKKHVICEKIMVTEIAELEALFSLAKQNQCFLMEAHKTVFTPLNQKIFQLVQDGIIGALRQIRAEYSYRLFDDDIQPDHWSVDPIYGGCAFDIGVYPTCFANYYANSMIQHAQTSKTHMPNYGCDFGLQALVTYENGIQASISSSWLYTPEAKGTGYLIGDLGYICIPAFWKGTKAYVYTNGTKQEIEVTMDSDFTGEIEHAIACISNNLLQSPLMGYTQSKAILELVKR